MRANMRLPVNSYSLNTLTCRSHEALIRESTCLEISPGHRSTINQSDFSVTTVCKEGFAIIFVKFADIYILLRYTGSALPQCHDIGIIR